MASLGASRPVLWPGTRRDVHPYTLVTAPGPPRGPPGLLRTSDAQVAFGPWGSSGPLRAIPARPPRRAR
jgi:hypothetical protein